MDAASGWAHRAPCPHGGGGRQGSTPRRLQSFLGRQLGLFSLQADAGGGLVFWHPKGANVRRGIEDFWKDAHVDGGRGERVKRQVALLPQHDREEADGDPEAQPVMMRLQSDLLPALQQAAAGKLETDSLRFDAL